MIITRHEGRLLVVRQPEHGVQTGLFGLGLPVEAQLVDDRACADPEDWLATLSAAPRFSLDCTVLR